jgi:hypothetical protein
MPTPLERCSGPVTLGNSSSINIDSGRQGNDKETIGNLKANLQHSLFDSLFNNLEPCSSSCSVEISASPKKTKELINY